MTKQKWIVTGIGIPIFLATVGLGFAAMSTNPPFIIPFWLPLLFFILAVFEFIALGVYLLWAFLTQFRLQPPIININQRGKVNIASNIRVSESHIPSRLIYDNVLWEDGGINEWGNIRVEGPFCPKDLTPLAMTQNDRVETHVDYQRVISGAVYEYRLFCLQCKAEYLLGDNPKRLKNSHDEVYKLFEGIRKRGQ